MTVGTFCAAKATTVPVKDIKQPTMKNHFRPNISERPPESGSDTETAIV
jgi:hypothetical protein